MKKEKINKKAEIKTEVKTEVNKEAEVKINRHILRGRVISAKSQKTATVLIEGRKTHKLYGKSYKQSKRYLVLDELGVSEGDIVEIMKCKPVSKNKHYKITDILGRSIEAMVNEELKEGVSEAIAEVMPEEKVEESGAVSAEPEEIKNQKSKIKSSDKKSKIKEK
jgi:small subunit ribosomal protein S17